MNVAFVVFSLMASACSRPDCDGSKRLWADDGNCYALDDGGEAGTYPDIPWLSDGALVAGVQDRFRRNRGVAAADFDGDGDVDLFLANPDDPSTLLLNNGFGVFAEQPQAPTTGLDSAVAAADFDNDGDPDLMVSCGGWGDPCSTALFRNDGVEPGTGRVVFTDVSESAGLEMDERNGFGVAWGDYDGDGFLDVHLSNKKDWGAELTDTTNQLYRNNGDGSFTEVSADVGVAATGDHHVATWIDVEPDGHLDLFVPTLFGDNLLYRNQGDGSFIEDTPDALRRPYAAFGSSAADLNNDGLVDLLVTATSGSGWAPEDLGEVTTAFLNRGDGGFDAHPISEGMGSESDFREPVMGFAMGDLNMDGLTDLFLGNGEPSRGVRNRLLLGAPADGGGLRWEDATALIDAEAPRDDAVEPYRSYPHRSHGSVIVDVDGDLDLDLFIGNGGMNLMPDQEEPNRLFLSSMSEVHQAIEVELVGTVSNRDAVGALITVTSGGEDSGPVTRWVGRSSGFNSSLPVRQVIGLGERVPPYRVGVQWPSGIEQFVDLDSGQRAVVITENDP
jgi:hypothetical protein